MQRPVIDHLADADSDTKIQVEQSNDDDAIRFDIEGQEVLKVSRNPAGYALMELTHFNGGNQACFFGYQAG